MPRNGTGTYVRSDGVRTGATVYQQEEGAAIDILSVNLDAVDQDAADAMTASIANDGQTTILANLPMSGFKHTGVAAATAATDYLRADQGQGQAGPSWAGTFGGTANALTSTLSPAITAYTAGLVIRGIAASANTATATLNSNAVGTITINKLMASGKVALVGGEWNTGDLLVFVSDGTNLILINKVEWQQGAAIASATTTSIGNSLGEYVTVTGTTTITGLGTIAAGTTRIVTFTGALLLTYNATSLILPGLASITTAAGDSMIAVSLGSGNWRVVLFQTAITPSYGLTAAQVWAAAVSM